MFGVGTDEEWYFFKFNLFYKKKTNELTQLEHNTGEDKQNFLYHRITKLGNEVQLVFIMMLACHVLSCLFRFL